MCCTHAKLALPARRRAVLPSHVFAEPFAAPVGDVERGIGEDVVGPEILVEVVVERVAVLRADVPFDAANGEIHLAQPPRRGIRLLAVDREVADAAAVGEDELLALHEHAAGAAARIVDAALVRLDHLDKEPDNGLRRVELATALAFGAGELAEEVFVNAPENVLRTALGVAQADLADQVDEFAESRLVERRPGVVLRQAHP